MILRKNIIFKNALAFFEIMDKVDSGIYSDCLSICFGSLRELKPIVR